MSADYSAKHIQECSLQFYSPRKEGPPKPINSTMNKVVMCSYKGILLRKRKDEPTAICRIWMNLTDKILGKISQTQESVIFDSMYKSIYCISHLYCTTSLKNKQN